MSINKIQSPVSNQRNYNLYSTPSFRGKNSSQTPASDFSDLQHEKVSIGQKLLGFFKGITIKKNAENFEYVFTLNTDKPAQKPPVAEQAPAQKTEDASTIVIENFEEKARIVELQEENKKLKTFADSLKSKLSALETELKKQKNENSNLQNQNNSLRQQLNEAEKEVKGQKLSELMNALKENAVAKEIPVQKLTVEKQTANKKISKETKSKKNTQEKAEIKKEPQIEKNTQTSSQKSSLDAIYEERQMHCGMFPTDIMGTECFKYRNKYDSARDEFLKKNRFDALKQLHSNEDKGFVKYFHSVPLYYFGSGLPIHYCKANEMEEIHKYFADEPEVLIKLHLTNTQNSGCYGLPLHSLIYNDSKNAVKTIHKLFENRPDVLEKLFMTEGFARWCPAQMPRCNLFEVNDAFRNSPDVLEKIYRKKDNIGTMALHNHPNSVEAVLDAFPDRLDIVEELLLAPDKYHQLPILHTSNPDSIKKILAAFKHKPEIIEKLLTTQSIIGYSYFHWQPIASEQGKTVFEAIKNNPDLIVKILLLKDNDGKYPIQHAQKKWKPMKGELNGGDFSDRYTREETFAVIKEALAKYPKHLKKVMDAYDPIDYDRYQR